MMRMIRSLAAATFVLGLLAGIVLADAQSDYETLFGQEARKVAGTKDTRDDVDFAAKVLKAAKSMRDDPRLQVLLYEKACDFAMVDPKGHPTAHEAIKLLEQLVPDRQGEWRSRKLKILEFGYTRSRGSAKKEAGAQYLEALLTLADEKAAAGKAKEAYELYRRAYGVAGYIRSPRVAEIGARIKQINLRAIAAAKRESQFKKLAAALAANPGDPAARTELILFCLVELDDPAKAASLVTKGVDQKLRENVPLTAKKPADLTEPACLELGQWYHKTLLPKASAAGKPIVLARAKMYYERYLSLHTKHDASRYRVSAALAEVNKALKKLGGVALPRDVVPWAGHYYKRVDTPMSFTMAERRCGEMGGHLVRIESEKEQQFVASLAKRGGFKWHWIDGSDEQKEGQWKFSNGQAMAFTAWGSGQPDDRTGRQNKVHMVEDWGWRWNDAPPSRKCGFICEWDAKLATTPVFR